MHGTQQALRSCLEVVGAEDLYRAECGRAVLTRRCWAGWQFPQWLPLAAAAPDSAEGGAGMGTPQGLWAHGWGALGGGAVTWVLPELWSGMWAGALPGSPQAALTAGSCQHWDGGCVLWGPKHSSLRQRSQSQCQSRQSH